MTREQRRAEIRMLRSRIAKNFKEILSRMEALVMGERRQKIQDMRAQLTELEAEGDDDGQATGT